MNVYEFAGEHPILAIVLALILVGIARLCGLAAIGVVCAWRDK